jgi:hypothetical protein
MKISEELGVRTKGGGFLPWFGGRRVTCVYKHARRLACLLGRPLRSNQVRTKP